MMVNVKHLSLHQKQNGKCFYCGIALTDGTDAKTGLSLDHIIPKSLGGSNKIDNLVLCCRSCNSVRARLDFDTFCAIAELYKSHYSERTTIGEFTRACKKAFDIFPSTTRLTHRQCLEIVLDNLENDLIQTDGLLDFIKAIGD